MNWFRGLAGVVVLGLVVLLTGSARSQPPAGPSVTAEIEFKIVKNAPPLQDDYYMRTKGTWHNLPMGASPKVIITERSVGIWPPQPNSRQTTLFSVDFETDWIVIGTPPPVPNFDTYESKIEPSYKTGGATQTLPTITKTKQISS